MDNDLLSIGIANTKEVADLTPFYYTDGNKYRKYKQLRTSSTLSAGLPLKNAFSHHHQINFVLKKHRTDAFAIICFNWKNVKPIKTLLIPNLYSDRNNNIIFKICGEKQSYLLFYQECISIIEIRHLLSLKMKKTFNFLTICHALGLVSKFQEMRVCVDAIYMPNRGAVLMCLNTMIVYCEDETKPVVLFQFENPKLKDRFLSVQWSCQQNVLFAETANSIMLFEFGEEGLSRTRVFQHPWLQHCNSRIVDWEPRGNLVISAHRTKLMRENLYVFHYSEDGLKLLAYVSDVLGRSINYSAQKKQLLFVDEDYSGTRQVRTLFPFKMLEEQYRFEMKDEDKLEKGELLATLPELVKMRPPCYPGFQNGILIVRFLL